MLTVQKSYGIVQRILTRLTSLKMATLQSPLPRGEGKDPIPSLSPRERGRSQRSDRCVQRKMWDTLSPARRVSLPALNQRRDYTPQSSIVATLGEAPPRPCAQPAIPTLESRRAPSVHRQASFCMIQARSHATKFVPWVLIRMTIASLRVISQPTQETAGLLLPQGGST